MPVVALVRHGQASFGGDDYDVLSDLGRTQATVAGEELARRRLRSPVLVSGTLRRQQDSAAAVVAATGWGPASVDARWDEYDHLGLVQRYAAAGAAPPTDSRSLQDLLDVALSAWIGAGDADGWPVFRDASAAALDELVTGLDGRDAVVVTSGGVVAALTAGLLGAGAEAVVALNRVTVNAGITTLLAGRGGVRLLSFNDHAHFAGDRRSLQTYR